MLMRQLEKLLQPVDNDQQVLPRTQPDAVGDALQTGVIRLQQRRELMLSFQ